MRFASAPLFATLLLTCLQFTSVTMAGDSVSFYIGPYTRGESRGIYQAKLDTESGNLHSLKLAAELDNPSFLVLHPTKPIVYAVSEVANFGGEKAGAVSALQRDPKTNELRLLNQQTTKGAHPCHVSVTPCGKFVLAANYSGGSVACYPVQPDGSLGPMSGFVQHEGSSVSPRQKGPHAHCIDPDPSGRFLYSCDLGCDKVFIHQLKEGAFVPNQPAFATVSPGSGPRHFAIHPKAPFAYAINELLSTITVFTRNAQTGALTAIQTISTLPDAFDGKNTTAEIRIHPSGQFPLRFQPWPRQHRHVPHRPEDRRADRNRPYAVRRQLASQLHHRSLGTLSPGSPSILRQRRRLSYQLANRAPRANRK